MKTETKNRLLGGYFKNSAYHEYYDELYGGYSDIQHSDIQEGGVGKCPGDTIKNEEKCPSGKFFCYDTKKKVL